MVLLWLLFALPFAFSADKPPTFKYPPNAGENNDPFDKNNEVYKDGETIKVEWKSHADRNVDLFVKQYYPANTRPRENRLSGTSSDFVSGTIKSGMPPKTTSYDWKIEGGMFDAEDIPVPEGEQAVWVLQIGYVISVTEDTDYSSSVYFNVTAPKPSTHPSTPSSTPTSSTFDSKKTSDSGSKDTNSTGSNADNSNSRSDDGLSKSATAGVAVGATIGGLLVLAGVGWCGWKRLGHKAPAGLEPTVHEKGEDAVYYKSTGLHEMEERRGTHELEGEDEGKMSPMKPFTGPEGIFEAP